MLDNTRATASSPVCGDYGAVLASVVLREDDGEPVAMYVVPPDADEAYRAALEELTGESEMAAWVWNAGVDEMPTLPI